MLKNAWLEFCANPYWRKFLDLKHVPLRSDLMGKERLTTLAIENLRFLFHISESVCFRERNHVKGHLVSDRN